MCVVVNIIICCTCIIHYICLAMCGGGCILAGMSMNMRNERAYRRHVIEL